MKAEVRVENKGDPERERFKVIVDGPHEGHYITCATYFAAQIIADAFAGVTDIGKI